MPILNRVRAEHARTFTGCRTCRRRHAKCDEKKPECRICRRLGLKCGGYAAQLSWIIDETATGTSTDDQGYYVPGYRYTLFTTDERQSMSDELSASLGSQTTGKVLLDLDLASKQDESQTNLGLIKGPFTVFRARESRQKSLSEQSQASSSISVISHDAEDRQSEGSAESSNDLLDVNLREPNLSVGLDSLFDTLPFSISPEHDLNISDMFPAPDIFTEIETAWADTDIPIDPEMLATKDITMTEDEIAPNEDTSAISGIVTRLNTANNITNCDLPEQAHILLRHYQQHMASSRSTIRINRKSPWQLIFLPCAFETFAELSVLNVTSNTRNTILHAVLAQSALRLQGTDKSNDYWEKVGMRHRSKAQFYLKKAVESEMDHIEPKKYKELLMAFLSVATVSLYRGGPSAKIFLVDAERLIRIRGLNRHNPFKIRVLHHLYTYLRVIVESISTIAGSSTAYSDLNALPAHPAVRSFRLSKETLNIGLDPTVEKTRELGYADIHLETQGLWHQTLHSTLHGIPESLMTLMAQITSLANEKAELETRAICDIDLSAGLKHHITTLEDAIWSWSLDTELASVQISDNTLPAQEYNDLIRHPCTQSMVHSIHQALILYFYRRIHGVSSMILQDTVHQALQHLEDCIEKMVDDDDFAPSLAWAAYVSGCEAQRPDLRARALRCVSITDSHGVYFTSKPSTEVLPSIWGSKSHMESSYDLIAA